MNTLMWLVLAILLVLSPAILYKLFGFLITAWRSQWLACGMRGLKCVNFIRATIEVDGKRTPDSWSYYVCEKCGAGFKWHRGLWSNISEQEIREVSGGRPY